MDKIKTKKDCWDKTKIIFEIVFGLIIGGIITFYGHQINANLRQKELNIKMIEVAVDILKMKPSQEIDKLREWAIDVLNKYSEIPLSEEAQNELKNQPIHRVYRLTETDKGWAFVDESGSPVIEPISFK